MSLLQPSNTPHSSLDYLSCLNETNMMVTTVARELDSGAIQAQRMLVLVMKRTELELS